MSEVTRREKTGDGGINRSIFILFLFYYQVATLQSSITVQVTINTISLFCNAK